MVIDQLLTQDPADIESAYILFVPRRTIECDEYILSNKALIEERINGNRNSKRSWQIEDRIQQFQIDLFLLEEDLLSLELPDDFRHFLLADDDTY